MNARRTCDKRDDQGRAEHFSAGYILLLFVISISYDGGMYQFSVYTALFNLILLLHAVLHLPQSRDRGTALYELEKNIRARERQIYAQHVLLLYHPNPQ